MKQFFTQIRQGLTDIIFPSVCCCCGQTAHEELELFCYECAFMRFDSPNPEYNDACAGVILPEHVQLQDALWRFDKGGALQSVLHQLKYANMAILGVALGKLLGARLLTHPTFQENEWKTAVLVPVPLHPKRFSSRGYNQAERIAAGIALIHSLQIVAKEAVIRNRVTKTQTGFSLIKRQENIQKAFEVRDTEAIKGKSVIIVDDVFTTGATTFELATTLKDAGATQIAVISVAMA